MRFPILALALGLVVTAPYVRAQNATVPGPLTLAEAQRLAETANTGVRTREAQLAAAEGMRREAASPFFNNPELSVERTRRRALDERANEWSVGIAQPFEIAGQQGRRRDAAAASLDALRAEIEDARRQARSDAASRFNAVLAAQRRLQVEQRSVELFDRTSQAVAKRRTAGEDTRLDANVALIEAERARNALARAGEQLLDARGELATVLQLPMAAMPEVAGNMGMPSGDALPYRLDQLLAATQMLPRQRALVARLEAARARVGLAEAGRFPDIKVGLNAGREGPDIARERLTTLSLSVPLPIFTRNNAAIGEALTVATQAGIDQTSSVRNVQAKVQQLWSRLDSQRARLQRLQATLLPASADNQQLATQSRQAGQIGLLEQLIVNRQALDAERDLIDALADFHTTRIELENAAGWSQEGLTR